MKVFILLVISSILLLSACVSPEVEKQEKEQITREKNIDTVRKFFRLLEEEKINEFAELYAENGKQVNPYHSGLFPAEIVSKEKLYEFWKDVPGNFDGMRFPIEEMLPFNDPNKIAVRVTGKITLQNNAGLYENDYLCIFHFDEQGKILEYHEYFNPLTAAKGFGLLDKIK